MTFEGVLTVRDPHALVRHLENGIGPAKAFGCGLMMVRRIGSM
ncbi:MAG: type I-E CRISPR-associated protein Cas6/Cse3/CasE [Chromatiaceae bacterium]